MRGPIDYIVVGFVGNNFKGDILKELETATKNGTIAVMDMAVVSKSKDGSVDTVEMTALDDPVIKALLPNGSGGFIDDEDIAEVADLLDNDCSAGLLIIEHTWAKGLKRALIAANGVLLAEGRIHPEAFMELDKKEDK